MRRIVWVVTVVLVVLAVVAGALALLWPALGRSIWSQVHTYRWWIPLLVVAAALVLLGWLFITFLRQPTGSTWRNNVLTATSALEHEFDLLPVERTSAERDLRRSTSRALHEHLEAARTAAAHRALARLRLPVHRLVDRQLGRGRLPQPPRGRDHPGPGDPGR